MNNNGISVYFYINNGYTIRARHLLLNCRSFDSDSRSKQRKLVSNKPLSPLTIQQVRPFPWPANF